ncbi:CvpA family protein [Streptococcus panodentis]|uniref:Colicin V production protein n=1 Tax=Streptococcus panodentis TaxID=1581472 RepID=A0ABS5AWI0_9STRE|nr:MULTISPECIES: CvpA family protein [Streptococcus]KXT85564.1 Colicin V production protein [Streptococcus sp. DD11]MBP2620598.1 colicin V production protein [Streptococcus panodentis]
MLSFVILLILAWSFYIGYSRGIVLQGYYALATVVAMLAASQVYKELAGKISLWIPYASATEGSSTYFFPSSQLFHLDKVFYAGLAYLFVFTAVYVLARFFGIFANLIPYPNKLDTHWYNVGSGVIAVCITVFVLQMCLTILATVPLAVIQDRLNGSFMVRLIVSYAPVTTDLLKHLWVTSIIG